MQTLREVSSMNLFIYIFIFLFCHNSFNNQSKNNDVDNYYFTRAQIEQYILNFEVKTNIELVECTVNIDLNGSST